MQALSFWVTMGINDDTDELDPNIKALAELLTGIALREVLQERDQSTDSLDDVEPHD